MKHHRLISIILTILCVVLFTGCGKADNFSNTIHTQTLEITDTNRYAEFISDGVDILSDIIFQEDAVGYDGQTHTLTLDIYTPEGDVETNRPAILLVHGGSYTSGDKANEGLLKYLAVDFAKMGYVSIVPNYRLGKNIELADINRAVEDVKYALEWVRSNGQNYGIDTGHIALLGYSAGGGIVQNLCYSNLYEEMDRTGILGVISISGEGLHYSFTGQAAPACLALHGTADTTVKYSLSEKFVKNLANKGIAGELYSLKGLNHNLLTRYDEIRNKIGSFLYQQLTGQERKITIISEMDVEYSSVLTRLDNGIEYRAKTLECVIDGNLEEWGTLDIIEMNQLKDAGDSIPAEEDYCGKAMVGWNPKFPNIVYIAAVVTDDVYQDNIPADSQWYHDDCLEIIFDFSAAGTCEQLTKYVIGASGDLSVLANKDSVQASITRDGNTYTYEIAIDLSVMAEGTLKAEDAGALVQGKCIGFSIGYNDSDNGSRESQIGWTAGKSSDRAVMGNLWIE